MYERGKEMLLIFDIVLPDGEKEQFYQRLYPLAKQNLYNSSGGRKIAHAIAKAATFDMGIVWVTHKELADLVGGRTCVVLSSYGHQIVQSS